MARTPPAMRRCGHRNVIFTRRSEGHRNPATLPVGLGVEHHGEAPDLVAGERLRERGADLARIRDERATSAERLDHAVVAGRRQRGGDGPGLAEERDLGAPDLAPAAVVADDAGERESEAHRGFELHAVEPEGAVARHEQNALVRAEELRDECEWGPTPRHPSGPGSSHCPARSTG